MSFEAEYNREKDSYRRRITRKSLILTSGFSLPFFLCTDKCLSEKKTIKIQDLRFVTKGPGNVVTFLPNDISHTWIFINTVVTVSNPER